MTCFSCGRRPHELCVYWDGCPYEAMHNLLAVWEKNADRLLEDADYLQEKLDLRAAVECRLKANLIRRMAHELQALMDRQKQ